MRYADAQQARSIEASSSCQCFETFSKKGPINDIECFLASLEVVQASEDQGRGVTWLELYILYRIRGGRKPLADPLRCAQPKATADKQIAAFKRLMRGHIGRVLVAESEVNLFKPLKCIKDELAGVGILGKATKIACDVVVSPDEARALAIAMSQLLRTASLKKHHAFVNGTLNLIPHDFKLKGRAGWDSNLPIMTNCIEEESRWAKLFKQCYIRPLSYTVFHHCPSCSKGESSQRGAFQRRDLDIKLKCGFCQKSSPVRTWKCQCGTQWHTCAMHRGGYMQMQELMPPGECPLTGQPLRGQPPHKSPTAKRRVNRPYDEAAGVKKAKTPEIRGVKRKNIIFNDVHGRLKRPTLLGPVLSGRFYGASSSSSAPASRIA